MEKGRSERGISRIGVVIPGTVGLVLAIFGIAWGWWWSSPYTFQPLDEWSRRAGQNPWSALTFFLLADATAAALSLPVTAVLAVTAGAMFGRWLGTAVVLLASTTGGTVAFLASRHFLRPFLQRYWGPRLETICRGIEQDGPYYLLTIQLAPVFPFCLVNAAAGLSNMRTRTFWLVSQVGILPGAFLYVNAGVALGHVSSPNDAFAPSVWLTLVLLAAAPLLTRLALRRG